MTLLQRHASLGVFQSCSQLPQSTAPSGRFLSGQDLSCLGKRRPRTRQVGSGASDTLTLCTKNYSNKFPFNSIASKNSALLHYGAAPFSGA